MTGRSGLAAALALFLAGALVADSLWARGRGGHSGGKRGGGAHASAPAGGGARMGAARQGGGASMMAARPTGGASIPAARQAAGAPAAASVAAAAPAAAAHAGGRRAFAARGGFFVPGAFPRADGRYFGHPVLRTGALVGIAAMWAVPPPGYPAPVVVVPYIPSEYLEIGPDDRPVVTPPQGYWYFCPDASGYFPHVEECPGGWELVTPPGMVPAG